MFAEILKLFWDLIYQACIVLMFLMIPLCISMLVFFIYYFGIKKMRIPKRLKPPTSKKRNFLIRLFWDFPKRFILDMLTLDKDRYPNTGIYIFEGEQGSGKTIAAVQYMLEMKRKYPMMKFSSNIDIKGQDGNLTGLNDVITSLNGIYGQINFIDEIQNWLNSNESKNVPIEFISELCQQRKQSKQIIGTTQRFNRMAKQLRQETTVLMKPITILGCFTIVRVYKPNVDADGAIKKARCLKWYFFVHTNELREAYDTYAKVERLSLKGFKPRNEQIGYEETTA